MKDKLFKIGEIAKLFHLSVSSLRHYEALGMVVPEYTDPESGYRYYGLDQFESINTLRYLRQLDMPLDRISEFLAGRDLDKMEQLLEEQKIEVSRRITELESISGKIDRRLLQIFMSRNAVVDTISDIESPFVRLAWIKYDLPTDPGIEIDNPLKQIETDQEEALIFLGKAGLSISQEKLVKGCFDSYDGVFILLDDEDNYDGPVIRIYPQRCLKISFRGLHKDAEPYYRKLMDYMKANEMEPAGFSREITLVDQGLSQDPGDYLTEIRIPYKSRKDIRL